MSKRKKGKKFKTLTVEDIQTRTLIMDSLASKMWLRDMKRRERLRRVAHKLELIRSQKINYIV